MRIAHYAIATAVGFSVGLGVHASSLHQSDKLTPATLKSMVEGLGFEVKTLNAEEGKEKYELPMKSANLSIPVALEISASTNYIWLTVNLGPNAPTKKHEDLLKSNGAIQPTFFYITSKGALMAAEALDNRGITPAILKRCLEKLVADVDKTSTIWQN
jgi:hypothetical protein